MGVWLDSKSVGHRLPLLVGGAQDTTAFTFVTVPDVTESYANLARFSDDYYKGFDPKASAGFHIVFTDCVGFAVDQADLLFDKVRAQSKRLGCADCVGKRGE